MRHLKYSLRLLVVALFALALLTPALPAHTTTIANAAPASPTADDQNRDDDDDDDEQSGQRDPCRKALKGGHRNNELRRRCEAGSSSGIARGDFNGDGIGDLAVGVPFEDIADAQGGTIQDAGGVNVIYGSAAGLSATASPGDQFFGYAQTNGRAGSALASGDFDGDGYSDLAIGAPFDYALGSTFDDGSVRLSPFVFSNIRDGSSNTIDVSETIPPSPQQMVIRDAGRVHIFYGSPVGLNPNTWESLNLGNVLKNVPHALDEFGSSLAWGDFDGDGFGDLAVGIPGLNLQAGAVAIFYGSASRFRFSRRLPQLWTQDSDGIFDIAEAGDRFGATLAGGEFGISAGASDLAVGVPGEDLLVTVSVESTPVTIRDAGAVTVIYGVSPTPLPGIGPLPGLTANGSQFWTQNTFGIADIVEVDDRFGSALASFGLGGSDLAIGVPGEDLGTIRDAGAVNVIYFSPSANKLSFTNNQLWTQDSPDIEDVAEAGDAFGTALAGGDFDGNTLKDLAIGAPGETLNDQSTPISNAGAVHVIYYQSFGTGLSAMAGPGDQFWTQDSTNILDNAETGERFGSAMTAWDFGNGFMADLAIGVPFQSVGGFPGAGAVNLIYGDNTTFIPGLRATGNQFWTQDSPNIEGVAEAGDQFGRALY